MLFFSTQKLFCSQDIEVFILTFDDISKRLDLKDKVNLKFYDVTAWLTNYFNTHIAQYLEK